MANEEENKKDPESNKEEPTQEENSEKEEQGQDVEGNKKEEESKEEDTDPKKESEEKETSEEESDKEENSEEKDESSQEEESTEEDSDKEETSEENEDTEEISEKEDSSKEEKSSEEGSGEKETSEKDKTKSEESSKPKVEVVDSKSEKGSKVPIFVTILIIAIVGGGMFYLFGMDNDQGVDQNEEDMNISIGDETSPEQQTQMKGEVTVIEDPECDKCFNVSTLTQQLPFGNKTVLDVSEAGSLIEDYNITKAPVIIVENSNQNLGRAGFVQKGDAWVYEDSTPYMDIESGEVKGLVDLTLIHYPECDECLNNTALIQSLSQTFGVGSKEIFERGEAEDLIERYNISTYPTVLIEGEYKEYAFYEQVKEQGREQNETLILNKFNPPFYDGESESVKGKINMTFIEASECENCTQVSQLDMLLTRGMRGVENKTTITQSEAEDLIKELNITSLPTVIVTEEIKYYGNMFEELKKVGSIEDGRYVLRECEPLRLNCASISDE